MMSLAVPSPRDWRVGPLESREDRLAAGALYQRTFDYGSPELGLNPYMLSALQRVGGSAIGAKDSSGRLVAFAYGFHAVDENGRAYHYSQAAVVDPSQQGRGLGEVLKHAQRDHVVARTGVASMRWAFDPCLVRNAHFNLAKLGATGIDYVPDYYDEPGSDRLVVEWVFSGDAYERQRESARALAPGLTGRLAPDADGILALDEPAIAGARWVVFSRAPSPAATVALGEALRERFAQGDVLCWSTGIDAGSACYLAVPRSEVPHAA